MWAKKCKLSALWRPSGGPRGGGLLTWCRWFSAEIQEYEAAIKPCRGVTAQEIPRAVAQGDCRRLGPPVHAAARRIPGTRQDRRGACHKKWLTACSSLGSALFGCYLSCLTRPCCRWPPTTSRRKCSTCMPVARTSTDTSHQRSQCQA